MPSMDRSNLGLTLAAAFFCAALLPACGGGGGGGSGSASNASDPNPPPLKVVRVTADRRTNWERNKAVEFHFSSPLSKASIKPGIIEKAIQIGTVTANGRIPAKGCFQFLREGGKDVRNVVVFVPTRSDCDPEVLGCDDIPFGLSPFTTYEITIPDATTSKKILQNTAGKPIVEPYDTRFTTGEDYLKEIVQPRFVGVDGAGALGFNPPRFISGEVPYDAQILIAFDETMDPATLDLGANVLVKNETLSLLQNQTVLVPGTFTTDLCGKTWRFRPAFSYGGAGYDIAVTLTNGLKDLSGNPLANPQTVRFRTEVKAGIPTVQIISESFDTQARLDVANTSADWGIGTVGVLQGGVVTTTTVDIALSGVQYPTGVRTRVRDHPFAKSGSSGVGHDQWIFTQAEVGAAGAVTQIGWGPSSNLIYASDHSKVKVTLGHVSGEAVSTNFANNFDVGTPVKVSDSSYAIPSSYSTGIDPPCVTDSCAAGYWPFAPVTNFFEYNGKNNLLLDVDATPGTNYQITRIFFGPVGFPTRHVFAGTGVATATIPPEPVVPDTRFVKKRRTTIATSLFYDSGQSNPNYSTPIISPAVQTGGTTAAVVFEGADGILFPIPGNPNNVIPDPSSFTGYVSNIDQLDGKRFVRIQVTFTANVTTGQVPQINSISIPYITF